MRLFIYIIFLIMCAQPCVGQLFPGKGDNIDYLVTSGKDAGLKIGDDDHQQTIFFLVPTRNDAPVYVRIFDPGFNQQVDEINGTMNSETSYQLYGGAGCLSDSASRSVRSNQKHSGVFIDEKTFGSDPTWTKKWYSFGPINPKKGEFNPIFGGYVFKLVIDGIEGDDVNLYKVALSTSPETNIPLPGGNLFTYEYSFRLKSKGGSLAHVYPYMDQDIVSIKQFNFDSDNDVQLSFYSVVKKGDKAPASANGVWANSMHQIRKEEKKKCLDLQLKKRASWHNDMVMYILNQYGEAVPFFAAPIGDIRPKFSFERVK